MILRFAWHPTAYIYVLGLAAVLLSLVSFANATGCQNYGGGSNCPPQAPCCQSGWCSNAQSFCSLALGCQPENSFDDNTCLSLPQCVSFREDFDRSDSVIALNSFSGNPSDAPWTSDFLPNNARVENGHLVLTLEKGHSMNNFGNKPGFGATVSSTRWMLYGKVSARIKSGSPTVGIVSSFIYRSSLTGDEVDYEWVGKEPSQVQSNYYWRTPATMDTKDINYGNSIHSEIGVDLSKEFQVYTIEWLPDRLTWSVNNKVVRTMHKSEAFNGTQYPSSPSQIQFSIWDGGLGDPDTQAWAGGPTEWEGGSGPYEMYVDWVDIQCHSPVDPVSTSWPPKDQGFQGFVNPLERDASSPLAKEAIVLGTNAPTFSTLNEGGLHWGKFNGRYLVDGKFPIPTNRQRNDGGGGRNVHFNSNKQSPLAKFFPFMSIMLVYILACWFSFA